MPARSAGQGRGRLHSLFALGPGPAYRQIPEGYPGRFEGRQTARLPEGKPVNGRKARKNTPVERIGPGAEPNPGPDGPGLVAERSAGDFRPDWRKPTRTTQRLASM